MNKKPTVTQLIGLLDKPALMKWANKIGLDGIKLEDYQKESKKKGTSIHKQIEGKFHGIDFEEKETGVFFNNFIYDKYIIDMEKNIETEWFVGRYDAKILYNEEEYICDFKSNNGIYFENKLQLTAYRMANPNCKVAIVEVPNFIFKPIEIEYKKYEIIIKCLSKIWELKQELI